MELDFCSMGLALGLGQLSIHLLLSFQHSIFQENSTRTQRVHSAFRMAATQTETLTKPLIPIAVNNDLSPPAAQTNLKVVFGAMTLGKEGTASSPLNPLTDQPTNPKSRRRRSPHPHRRRRCCRHRCPPTTRSQRDRYRACLWNFRSFA